MSSEYVKEIKALQDNPQLVELALEYLKQQNLNMNYVGTKLLSELIALGVLLKKSSAYEFSVYYPILAKKNNLSVKWVKNSMILACCKNNCKVSKMFSDGWFYVKSKLEES